MNNKENEQKNREVRIQHLMEEFIGKGNLAIVEEMFATDYVAHAGEKSYRGHTFLNRFAKQLRAAVPDVHAVDVKVLAHDGDRIVWQRTLAGTHKETMQRIPASGKKLKWVEMVVSRFNEDQIAEEWVVSELMGQMLLKVPK